MGNCFFGIQYRKPKLVLRIGRGIDCANYCKKTKSVKQKSKVKLFCNIKDFPSDTTFPMQKPKDETKSFICKDDIRDYKDSK